MKNQKVKILLLIIVIIIWGVIAFKIYIQYFNSNDDKDKILTSHINSELNITKVDDSLFLNYQDPFLKSSANSTNHLNKKKLHIQEKIKVEENNIPEIKYKGLIVSGSKQLFVISANGKDEFVQINSKINDIKLLKGCNEFIEVYYNNSKYRIQRSY